MSEFVILLIEKVCRIPGVILALTLMGFCKAFSSDKLGDPTPRNMGRLNMNPFSHIDWFGFLMILLFNFGWGKPVTVNSRYYKHIKRDCAIQILSGPVGCIAGGFVLSFIYVLACKITDIQLFYPLDIQIGIKGFVTSMLLYAVEVCIFIGLFFLLPIPGFDGFDFIVNFLPPRANRFVYNVEKYRIIIFIAAIFILDYTVLGNILLYIPANFLINNFIGLFGKLFGL